MEGIYKTMLKEDRANYKQNEKYHTTNRDKNWIIVASITTLEIYETENACILEISR